MTALQAYQAWKAAPEKVFINDPRTPHDYIAAGHLEMAIDVPFQVWSGKCNREKKDFVLDKNPDFVAEVQKRHKPDDTLLIMCRSGHRAAPASEAAYQGRI